MLTSLKLWLFTLGVTLAPMFVFGQQPDEASEISQLLRWRRLYVDFAADYKFLVGNEDPVPANFNSEPLHFYSNPAGGTQTHGSLFVWTLDERPIVLGAIWSRKINDLRRTSGSFHVAAPLSVKGMRRGEVFWNPAPGFKMSSVGSPPAVANRKTQRLVQMKSIVRSLIALRIYGDEKAKLRVLPQPLYRYSNETVVDGALFGFFDNWDPELFVLIEVSQAEPNQWKIGMIRFSNKTLAVTRAGEEIWSFLRDGAEPPLGGANFGYISNEIDRRSYSLGGDLEKASRNKASATTKP